MECQLCKGIAVKTKGYSPKTTTRMLVRIMLVQSMCLTMAKVIAHISSQIFPLTITGRTMAMGQCWLLGNMSIMRLHLIIAPLAITKGCIVVDWLFIKHRILRCRATLELLTAHLVAMRQQAKMSLQNRAMQEVLPVHWLFNIETTLPMCPLRYQM